MSYNVSRRTNEIGIRMALGAQRTDVLRLVMRESMILVAIGVVAGVGIAIASSGLVSTLLFGLPPRDIRSMLLAVGVMVMVSALAGYLPARRASTRRSDGRAPLRVGAVREPPTAIDRPPRSRRPITESVRSRTLAHPAGADAVAPTAAFAAG